MPGAPGSVLAPSSDARSVPQNTVVTLWTLLEKALFDTTSGLGRHRIRGVAKRVRQAEVGHLLVVKHGVALLRNLLDLPRRWLNIASRRPWRRSPRAQRCRYVMFFLYSFALTRFGCTSSRYCLWQGHLGSAEVTRYFVAFLIKHV